MVTIYGSPRSSSGRCFWCLEETGINYTSKSINFKEKEHKSEEFIKINPNGKVPALEDGDFVIWESMAINFYLADAYKPILLGETSKERGLVHQWSIWSIADLQGPLIDIFIQLVFVPEERRNLEVIEKAKGKLPALLSVLNGALEGNNYLVGDQFSLADLNVHSVMSICDHVKYDLTEYKGICSWLETISDLDSFKKYQELCK